MSSTEYWTFVTKGANPLMMPTTDTCNEMEQKQIKTQQLKTLFMLLQVIKAVLNCQVFQMTFEWHDTENMVGTWVTILHKISKEPFHHCGIGWTALKSATENKKGPASMINTNFPVAPAAG